MICILIENNSQLLPQNRKQVFSSVAGNSFCTVYSSSHAQICRKKLRCSLLLQRLKSLLISVKAENFSDTTVTKSKSSVNFQKTRRNLQKTQIEQLSKTCRELAETCRKQPSANRTQLIWGLFQAKETNFSFPSDSNSISSGCGQHTQFHKLVFMYVA